MRKNFQEKIEDLTQKFKLLSTADLRFDALIEMGRQLPPLHPSLRSPEKLVPGCQSALFLASQLVHGNMIFSAACDALISAGLAALLIAIYNDEAPELILTHSPDFLTELGIHASLSPHRSNGLASIHLRMKQEALKFLIPQAEP